MNKFTSTTVCTFLGTALLAGIATGPEALRGLLREVGRLSEYERQLGEELQRGRRLDTEERETMGRIELKKQVIEEVVAGRLTLFEAAARFHTINANLPERLVGISLCGPVGLEEELLCRQVIEWTRGEAGWMSQQAEQLCPRLEAELDDHLTRYGRIVLPERVE